MTHSCKPSTWEVEAGGSLLSSDYKASVTYVKQIEDPHVLRLDKTDC